ncbi:MAG: ABC transporter ATP-binding protein [Candidatus Eisenbacteria bacterium]|uniref:ABC transporter ATP-binding protein n=1 Tax=Eiseniibacteriota bacterium TaxID=2212470 RepID=A0A538U0V8_UNCEI|nr:MAG: ABC transporter ATP-binding protein [Candidatus Eisenbacteria bacterium]
MTEPAIETRGLRKRFGEKLAVADLSLAVAQGEVFGFLGPNGAGKTTSLKMLLGLIEPSAGSARVLGAPLGNRLARARVGFLPEHFRFHEWLTGRELLRFHGRLYGLSGIALRDRIEELLRRVDLLEAGDRALRTYSKGMLQRVGLAQALLNEPRLVFLDEPTSGLDPIGRLLVRDVIHDLKSRGTAVFLNSHLLGEIEVTCDRVVFLKAGRTVRELTLKGRADRLEVELRVHDADRETLAGLERFGRALDPLGERMRLQLADEDRLPDIAAYLVARGARLYEMHAARPSLESVFLDVMGEDGRPG